MRVNSCIFIGNQATGTQSLGGAIYNSSSATFSIKMSTFKSNRATGKGNAIYLYNNLSNTTKVNYTAFIDNATVGIPSIHNEGPYILNGQCNYWLSSVSDLHIGVDSSNPRPSDRPLGLDEMLYPVFGEERASFDADELTPAIVANSFDASHRAVDIVPFKAFSGSNPCSIAPINDWDQSASTDLNVSLKTVYAISDGTLRAFIQDDFNNQGQAACMENGVAVPCNAQLLVNSGAYSGRLFLYAHITIVPPLAVNVDRPVKAGQIIGYIRNHNLDANAGPPSHLHFETRPYAGAVNDDPRRFLVTGLRESRSQKAYGLCPTQQCS